jgi:hypothetical protein
MDKVKEMWEALTAYQQQADDAGHGATWLAMCEERTADAAYCAAVDEAAYAADEAAAYAADAADYADAAASAADAAAAARAVYFAHCTTAEKWAQRAIERINKATIKEKT